MEKLNVKDKDIVVPGEVIAESLDYVPTAGTYRDGNKIIAAQVGMVAIDGRLVKLIQLSGKYFPREGDTVIGKVTNAGFNNWFIDVGYANEAVLSLKEATSEYIDRGADLSKYYDIGDYVMCKIIRVTRSVAMDLSMIGPGLRKLKGGKIIYITPAKVPRLIGKQGSMVNLIKEKTGCKISVGQNGWVWVQADDPKAEILATKAVQQIDENAHNHGLTDEITNLLSQEMKK